MVVNIHRLHVDIKYWSHGRCSTYRYGQILQTIAAGLIPGSLPAAAQAGKHVFTEKPHGIDHTVLISISQQIKEIRGLGVDVAIVLGAGNIFRGQENTGSLGLDMDRSVADYMGMLATVINGLALQNVLENIRRFTEADIEVMINRGHSGKLPICRRSNQDLHR
jgi:hypothetical protein